MPGSYTSQRVQMVSLHGIFSKRSPIKLNMVKTRRENCPCLQNATKPKTTSLNPHCIITGLLHKVTSGTSPLNWSGLSAAKNTSTVTAALRRGKMQPFPSFNGKAWVQTALLCPGSQERKCLLWWQNKKLFQGQEGKERESHIQLEILHDLKLPGESPQRVSMEREESILALPVTSQTTADDCE